MIKKTNKIIKKIAFFGDAEATTTSDHYLGAYNTASLLAKNGYTIVNGGGPGVMLASTLGAKSENGQVEVVILDPSKQPENYEGVDHQNISLADKIHTTNNYPERLSKLIEVADAYVIFNGGTGTLSEVGLTWENAKFEYGHHEPLIFFGSDWGDIIRDITSKLDFEAMEKNVIKNVTTPQAALSALKEFSS